LLEVDGIETCYGLSQVLFGMSLRSAGEMVALMGRNGMGKTTTIRSIMGLTDEAEEGEHRAGSAKAAALSKLAVDDEHGDRAQDDAGQRRAAAQRFQAVIEHADLRRACRSRPPAALVPAAPSALSIWSCPRRRSAAISASTIAGAWRCGVSWNACEPISMPM
jgi:ATPase subunit of ABC transporter with duplicated ATPase domains